MLNLMVGPTTGLKLGVILLKGRAFDGARTHDCKCNRSTPQGGSTHSNEQTLAKGNQGILFNIRRCSLQWRASQFLEVGGGS